VVYWWLRISMGEKRTIVRLDEDLLSEARRLAAEERTTLTAVLEQAVRELLARRKERPARPRVSLPSFTGRGPQPGVNLDDSAALLDLMEGRGGLH
jgi:hypothetical protein